MSAVARVTRSGVGRRRLQTLVMALVTLIAVTASVLAGSLLVASRTPFDHAFAQQNGAHLVLQFDGSKASATQVASTAHTSGVIRAAGPFQELSVDRVTGRTVGGQNANSGLPPMRIVGRSSPNGAVDDVTLTEGTWPTQVGQIVLASNYLGPQPSLGMTLQFPTLPGAPTLVVVGAAQSVSQTADAWVLPAQIAALRTAGAAPAFEMLYCLQKAATDNDITTGQSKIAATLPSGSVIGAQSYLNVRLQADQNTASIVPFIVAFGVLGLIMSVLIIGSMISGAVGASVHRIGILKSIGFTPAQVVRAYIARAVIPSAFGVGLGVASGNLLSIPLLARTQRVYGTATLSVSPWIDAAVPCATLAVVATTALLPALRAGRLSTIEAITIGRTPQTGRGRLARRTLARLSLPPALSLGLTNPFARPVRTLGMTAAIVFGAITITFAVGLISSLNAVQTALSRNGSADVTIRTATNPNNPVNVKPSGQHLVPPDSGAVASAIQSQPGTLSYYGVTVTQVTISGSSRASNAVLYQGDGSASYEMISGNWFNAPGQAVVPTRFLQVTGTHIGDTITLLDHGKDVSVRLVGEAFDTNDDGMDVLTGISTFSTIDPNTQVNSYNIKLKPGTDLEAYVATLNNQLTPLGAHARANTHNNKVIFSILDTMVAALGLILVGVAALGVLNTVVLDTRERAHDISVYKALGMTPQQTIAMIIASVAAIGLIAGAVGLPTGIALHHYILPIMANAAGTNVPPSAIAVYRPGQLVLLGLGGIVIAILGALLPAALTAKTYPAASLRTE